MPARNIDQYFMRDARNNFDSIRPVPICTDANQLVGHCQNIHISTNCYYGYHDPKSAGNAQIATATSPDCEMMDVQPTATNGSAAPASPHSRARKRAADLVEYPHNKRLREEVQRANANEPETMKTMPREKGDEDLENLYWNIHGGNMFHLIECL